VTGSFILDASAAIAWASPDEAPPAVISRAIAGAVPIVPQLWLYEVHNALLMLLRRRRLTQEGWQAASAVLAAVPIEVDSAPRLRVEQDIVELARVQNLTVYDTVYLELAKRHRLPLATLDDALRKAAKKVKVKLL